MIKKEEYQSPAIEVVGIDNESQIMSVSGGESSIQYGGSADSYFDNEDEGGSTGSGSIWAE